MLIDLIIKTINFLKGLTLWQIVLYQFGLICLLQLSIWLVEFIMKRV